MRKIPPVARQWVISTTAILFILIGTLILVAFAQGYSFDSVTRTVRANGLVLIDSNPSGAEVIINGKDTNKRTPFRYTNAPQGDIVTTLIKPDYRNWQAKQKVYARQVTFLDYALLLPNILTQNNVPQEKLYLNTFQSLDHSRTIAFVKDSLEVLNITDGNQPKTIYQPQPNIIDPSKNAVEVQFVQITNDGSKALIKQKLANNTYETVLVHTNGSPSENLTKEFGFDFTNIWFNQRDTNELFWLDSTNLKKIKINNKSISSNLVTDVLDISIEKDRLLIAKASSDLAITNLYSYDLAGLDERKISDLVADPSGYEMSFINSRYNEFILVKQNSGDKTQLIMNPYGLDKSTKNIGQNITNYTISPNQRFIVLNQENTLKTIDLEFNQEYSYGTSLNGLQNWTWFDNYHVVLLQDRQLRMVDFDGQNNYLLTPIADSIAFSVNTGDKAILPLNNTGNIFKLWLTKK